MPLSSPSKQIIIIIVVVVVVVEETSLMVAFNGSDWIGSVNGFLSLVAYLSLTSFTLLFLVTATRLPFAR